MPIASARISAHRDRLGIQLAQHHSAVDRHVDQAAAHGDRQLVVGRAVHRQRITGVRDPGIAGPVTDQHLLGLGRDYGVLVVVRPLVIEHHATEPGGLQRGGDRQL